MEEGVGEGVMYDILDSGLMYDFSFLDRQPSSQYASCRMVRGAIAVKEL